MSGADKTLDEEIVGINGESTAGLHQHLEPRLAVPPTPPLLRGENGTAKHRAAAEDAEMPPAVCAQKYRNIWAASCSCLFQKAKQNERELNSYQQQDENICRKTKYRMGEKGLMWEGRACEGGLRLGGVCYAVCIHVHPAYKENTVTNYINPCTYKQTLAHKHTCTWSGSSSLEGFF